MSTVFIPPQMRDLTRGAEHLAATGATLREVLRRLDGDFPGLYDRVVVGDAIAPGLAVSVDGSMTSKLLTTIQPESEIHFLPAIGGG